MKFYALEINPLLLLNQADIDKFCQKKETLCYNLKEMKLKIVSLIKYPLKQIKILVMPIETRIMETWANGENI